MRLWCFYDGLADQNYVMLNIININIKILFKDSENTSKASTKLKVQSLEYLDACLRVS